MSSEQERRVAVLYVDEQLLLVMLDMLLLGKKYEYEPRFPPESTLRLSECEVLRVHTAWDRRAFGLLLSHPSFEVVEDGGIPPNLNLNVVYEKVGDKCVTVVGG